jgi:hypothetical protein
MDEQFIEEEVEPTPKLQDLATPPVLQGSIDQFQAWLDRQAEILSQATTEDANNNVMISSYHKPSITKDDYQDIRNSNLK